MGDCYLSSTLFVPSGTVLHDTRLCEARALRGRRGTMAAGRGIQAPFGSWSDWGGVKGADSTARIVRCSPGRSVAGWLAEVCRFRDPRLWQLVTWFAYGGCSTSTDEFMAQMGVPARSPRAERAVIDLRSRKDFCAAHIKGSYNIPIDAFNQHGFETPPRHVPIVFVTSPEQLAAACAFAASHARLFRTVAVLEFSEHMARRAADARALEWGPNPCGRLLFKMTPLLGDEIAQAEVGARRARARDGGNRPLRALDVGCGSGRDVIHLALRGWRVLGIDSMAKALARCRQLAEAQGCSGRVALRAAKLRAAGDLLAEVEKSGFVQGSARGAFDLVLVSRFHMRELLPDLAEALAPGGRLLYHTFMSECKRPASLEKKVQRGYLAGLVAESARLHQGPWRGVRLRVLRDDVGKTPGHDCVGGDERNLSFFVAERLDA